VTPRRLLLAAAVVVIAAGAAVVLGMTPVDRPAFIDRLEYPLDYGDIVRAHAAENRLDSALVAAVIYEESRFRPHALSKVGAMGLMQIQPVTGETIAHRTGGTSFQVSDLYDPDINVRYGSWYLRTLIDKYGDERLALAAYNAGETMVDGWLRDGKGIAATDVQAYVDGVEGTKKIYRHAYGSDLPQN
jgi:soluble lytic murein transglycosylase